MSIIPAAIQRSFADFVRIYRLLPSSLQRRTLCVLGFALLQTLLEVLAVLAISALALSIGSPDHLAEHHIVRKVLEAAPWLAPYLQDMRTLTLLVASLATLLIAFKNAVGAGVCFLGGHLGERIAQFAGESIFRDFLYCPYVRHLAGDGQNTLQMLAWRSDLGRMTVQMLAVFSYAAITLALGLLLLLVTPFSVLLLLGTILAGALLLYARLKKGIDRAGKHVAESKLQEHSLCLNAMQGIREILIYGQQEVFYESFRTSCGRCTSDNAFLVMAPTLPTWILETLGFAGLGATVWIMARLLDAALGDITSVLTLIMLVCWRVLPLLNRTLGALVIVRATRHSALECLARLEEVLRRPKPPGTAPDPAFSLRRDIRLRDVSFSYPGSRTPSLSHISITIPHGSTLGIVGRSGAGKSSLAALLSGLIDPDLGELLIDGRRLTPAARAAYCRQIGYVPQNPCILAGSIAENVAFSAWGKPWKRENVLRACKMAELDVAFSRGLDTPLGQNGAGLSGGQAQRLAIARALYAEPSVLILDEATSALDGGVESAIMRTIFSLPKSLTTIIIAHRLSTVEACDHIVWLEQGKIRKQGNSREVLPVYRKFLSASADSPAPQA